MADDTFTVMGHLAKRGTETTFRLGDSDLATCLCRTTALRRNETLGEVTNRLCAAFGVAIRLLPATNDPLRTRIRIEDGSWLSFQEYFVGRGHRDEVTAVRFDRADDAAPAPGVLEAVRQADLIVIAPSNPPLSIWPILAVPGIRAAVAAAPRVVAVSPLFGGRALRGPADRVMLSLGLPPGNAGVLEAYRGLITDLVVDRGDEADVGRLAGDVALHAADTRITEPAAAAAFSTWLVEAMS
jgi:LPPG:FO 2-phospho-L-lactate transferase